MSLTLYAHPLSSFCWKVLTGLYENDIVFENAMVNLGDPAGREAFLKLSPMGKMPALRDDLRDETVLETSIILDYLDLRYPGRVRFVPQDPDLAWRTRFWDRFFDHYIHHPMQRIVADRIRPAEAGKDPYGVRESHAQLATACDHLEKQLADGRSWMCGAFGLADCAAMPALFYADKVQPPEAPFGDRWPLGQAYLERLKSRPSIQRVLAEAEPFFQYFPKA